MANKKLLGLLVLCLFIHVIECGRFGGGRSGGRSGSSSRGGSSWGRGWGGSSSSSGSSWSKPSSSSSSWGSSGSSYKPSSSWNTGSSSSSSWGSSYKPSSSSGSHSYPSNTGLSGSGSSWNKPSSSSSGFGSHSYPSNTGLSGSGSSWNKPSSSSSGFGTHSYPSNTGLSGSGSSSSGAAKYPTSSTGLSGSGSGSHSYPSGTGLSGSGSSRYPSSSGTHSYPSGTGLSGSGSNTHNNPSYGNSNYNRPKPTYNTNSGYNTNTGYHGSYQPHYIPTYYTAPQHVYVTQYRDSGSRYSDLLTGLTLYNMGRSHSYHDHYYVDDYHRHRYMSTGSYNNQQSNYDRPNNEATCSLRIKENGKLQELKVPCEIVSTFTEGSKKVESDARMNKTVCTTNTTVTKTTPFTNKPTTVELSTTPAPVITANITETSGIQTNENKTELSKPEVTSKTLLLPQNTTTPSNVTLTASQPIANVSSGVTTASTPIQNVTVTETPIIHVSNKTNGNVFTQTVEIQKSTETIVNVTVCTTIEGYIDPLTVKGGPIDDQSIKECSIDIKTKEALIRHTIECATLMEYSKMPPPAKDQKPLLPPREKLKAWMEKPPWWMAMFIAV